MEFSICKMI